MRGQHESMRYSEGAAEGLLGTTPTIVARVVIRDSNVVLRLAIARHDCLLSCSRTCAHDDDGADTRHATTTERWTERPLSEALQYLYGLAAADSTRLIEMGAVWLQDLRITRRGVPVPPRASPPAEAAAASHAWPRTRATPRGLPHLKPTGLYLTYTLKLYYYLTTPTPPTPTGLHCRQTPTPSPPTSAVPAAPSSP